MALVFIILLAFTLDTASSQLVSPCPTFFRYEPPSNETEKWNNNKTKRWYGQMAVVSHTDLSGLWLKLILDRRSSQLGNWFGEVITYNKDYVIRNKSYKLKANEPLTIRFYIKYKTNEPPPQLLEFYVNTKRVCPEDGATTQAPTTTTQILTSTMLTTTTSTTTTPDSPEPEVSEQTLERSGDGFAINNQGPDEDDFFHGDFTFLNKPQQNILDSACGVVIKQPQPLVTYGRASQEGEFPWHAALYYAKNIDLSYICGASLISRFHLITVAHCVSRRKTQRTLPPESVVVFLGKFYLKHWLDPGIQHKQVKKIIVHPKYNNQIFSHNIAILKLVSAVDITDYVRPVCLWEGTTALEAVIGKEGTVAGWGFDENGNVAEKLTKAQMPVVSQETCVYSSDFYLRYTPENTFCAGFKNGTSVCNGDSGGGLVFPKPGSNQNNPVWAVRGIVAISLALQNKTRCDTMNYVVFTDIAKYLDWVKEVLMM